MEYLKKKRGCLRSSTTKLLKRVEKDLQEHPDDTDTLEDLLNDLERKEAELLHLDAEIETQLEDVALEAEYNETEEYKERITMWKARLLRYIKKGNDKEDSMSHISEHSERASCAGKPSSGIHTLKLPRLTLETFTGDSATWQGFWAQFRSSIHENEQLSKVDKFSYLKCFVKGVAGNAIAGLALTEANCDEAIKILLDRFGRRDLVISAHMTNMLSLSTIKKSTDIVALRKLYDACEIQVRSLESMGVESETYSMLLCPILMRMIPGDIILEFNRRHDDSDWKVTELLNLLKKEIESRERTLLLARPLETENSVDKTKNKAASNYNNNKKEKQNNSYGDFVE